MVETNLPLGGGTDIEKITLAEWKARKEAGTLEEGVMYDTYDEFGEDNTLDMLVTKAELANVDAKTVNGLSLSVDENGILNITYDDGN